MDNLKIVTITTSCHFGAEIDIEHIFTDLISKAEEGLEAEDLRFSILEMKLGDKVHVLNIAHVVDATTAEASKRGRKKKPKKTFTNQITFVLADTQNNIRRISIKLFRNGQCEMTGLLNMEEGQTIVDLVKKCAGLQDIGYPEMKVRLINASFKHGRTIDRNELHRTLKNAGISFRYDPSIYHGVVVRRFDYENRKSEKTSNSIVFATGSVSINSKSFDGIDGLHETKRWISEILTNLEKKMDVPDVLNVSTAGSKSVGVVNGVVLTDDSHGNKDSARKQVDVVLSVNPNERLVSL